jgi:hypothetical protein
VSTSLHEGNYSKKMKDNKLNKKKQIKDVNSVGRRNIFYVIAIF